MKALDFMNCLCSTCFNKKKLRKKNSLKKVQRRKKHDVFFIQVFESKQASALLEIEMFENDHAQF